MNSLMLSSSSLIGEPVRDLQGEEFGRIEEIMLDAERGRIAYVILSREGSRDLDDRFFAIPWEAIRFDQSRGGDGLILDADPAILQRAPGFDRRNWPNFADPQFGIRIYNHYRIPPYWDIRTDLQ
jgi:sporulation protein YlmC with PRC-barrel domain